MNKKKYFIGLVIIIFLIGGTFLLVNHSFNERSKNENANPTSNSTTSLATVPASSTQIVLQNEYHVNQPNDLMLVDSEGRRTGMNPVTSILYHEIPGTSYSARGSCNDGRCSGVLFFSQNSKDRYTLYVLGGQTGPFILDAQVDEPFVLRQTISGNLILGSMDIYSFNDNISNLTSSTIISFQGSTSSMESITSAPPNNLPPPPVP